MLISLVTGPTSASLHDRTKTTNGSSESPPRNSGMLPESTVRRSTLGSTSSRPAVAFFLEANKKSQHILCSAALCESHPLPFFVTKPHVFMTMRIHRTARTALRRRAGCRSCMLPASCAPCSACSVVTALPQHCLGWPGLCEIRCMIMPCAIFAGHSQCAWVLSHHRARPLILYAQPFSRSIFSKRQHFPDHFPVSVENGAAQVPPLIQTGIYIYIYIMIVNQYRSFIDAF